MMLTREMVDRHLLELPDVTSAPSRWASDLGYSVDGREFLHFHSDAEIDLRLTRQEIARRRDELREIPGIVLRPSASDWLTIVLDAGSSSATILELVASAYVSARRQQ
jgi:hypothetical protein